MIPSVKKLLAGSGLATVALAASSISDSDMNNLLNGDGVQLAMKAQPMWFFGQSQNQPPCIPTWALTADNQQTPAAPLCAYPDVGCHCRQPGVPIVNPSPGFPVYYSFTKCNDNEIRVQYSLFYEKDGCWPEDLAGHAYDWERIVVIWTKGGDGNWSQGTALFSQHSGYERFAWGDIQNTINTEDAGLQRGGADGRKNLDHPKAYIAWDKHAIFDDRNTGWNDIASQLNGNAFRSNDWWHFNDASEYIKCDSSTACGQIIAGMNWGHATSTPPSVHDGLCWA